MIPVRAGANLAFEYTAYDGVPTLSVAMQVYDTTGGSPAYVATVGMTHVVNGTYVGYFTPLAGKQYLLNKMVYTDGTYATPSSAYSAGSETIQASTEQTDIGTILGDVVAMQTDVTAIHGDTGTLLSRLTATRANNLDNLDAAVSTRATQASVDNLQNNTTFSGIVPTSLIIPTSGSTVYTLYANLYDDSGTPVDPDGAILSIGITSGVTTVVPTTPMTHDGLGRYHFDYTVNSSDPERPLTVMFTYTYLSIPFTQIRVTQTTEFESSLDTLLSRLTAQRALNLDNLDATISSRASAAAVTAIQSVLANFHFNGNNVLAEAVLVDDKTGYSLSASMVTNLVNSIWNELVSSHTVSGSMGAAQGLISTAATASSSVDGKLTTARAAKLDNLDAAISTRADAASVAAVGAQVGNVQTSVNNVNAKLGTPAGASVSADIAEISTDVDGIFAKTTNLPSDPASQSATNAAISAATGGIPGISTTVNAIKAKTDNLPVDPASQSAVTAIPTNPLLTTDTRLNHLDANVSSRATPGDLAPLATTSDVSASESAILSALATVDTDVLSRASSAELAAAVAPLALQTTLSNVETEVLALGGGQISAADVWNYTPRGLTQPVDTTDDLSNVAKVADVNAARDAVIAALPKYECKLAGVVDPATDKLTLQVWLAKDNMVVAAPQTAQLDIYNSSGNPVVTALTSSTPSSLGVFTLVVNAASTLFAINNAYTVTITIAVGVSTYETTQSLTVF